MFEEPTTKQHLIANRLTPDQISKYINLAFSITIEVQNFTWISFYWKQESLAVIFAIYGGGHGGILNTATPQKNLTNTASPQEKSTKHRHRNNYF